MHSAVEKEITICVQRMINILNQNLEYWKIQSIMFDNDLQT